MPEPEKSKAEVEITVKYAGKEWEEWSDEIDPEYLHESLGDLIAGIDCDVRDEYRKREKLKSNLRGEEQTGLEVDVKKEKIDDPIDDKYTITINWKQV